MKEKDTRAEEVQRTRLQKLVLAQNQIVSVFSLLCMSVRVYWCTGVLEYG